MSVVDIDDEDDDKFLGYVSSLTQQQRSEALLKAVGEGNAPRTRMLLEAGADPFYLGGEALTIAAAGGRPDVIKTLLEKGYTTEQKSIALVMAVTAVRPRAVKLLLESGADPRRQESIALWYAAMRGDTAIAHDLLQAGADANAREGTLMALALSHRNDGVAKELLHSGADPAATYNERNAFEWAAEMHLEEFFQHLREWVKGDAYRGPAFFGAKTLPDLRAALPGQGNRTGLHMAAASGNFGVIRDKFIAAGEKITPGELKDAPGHSSPSVLLLLGQTGQLKDAFDARLWQGRKEEMLEAFAAVPETFRAQVDVNAVASEIDRLALKSGAKRLSLKPGPKP